MRPFVFVAFLLAAAGICAQTPYRPSAKELRESYRRADEFAKRAENAAFKLSLTPNWIDGARFWYRNDLKDGAREYWLVDSHAAKREPAFDASQLAASLGAVVGETLDPAKLEIATLRYTADLTSFTFGYKGAGYRYSRTSRTVERADLPSPPAGNGTRRASADSPDGNWAAAVDAGKIVVRSKTDGSIRATFGEANVFERFLWSPDSKRLVGLQLIPGDRKEVFLIESSPRNGGRATLRRRLYDQPGDKLDAYALFLLDLRTGGTTKLELEPISAGGQPWTSPPDIRWKADGRAFTVEIPHRGYQRFQVVEVDASTGSARTVLDESSQTFVDSTNQFLRFLDATGEIVWRSERDGWGHLYLIDQASGTVKNAITKGNWVVRTVDHIDETNRTITFGASGMNPLHDPYLIHYYRIGFDGSRLVRLTEGNGNHRVSFSPDRAYYVDSYSRVDSAPVHELRRATDGKVVMALETADIAGLQRNGVRLPEVFSAKGRDGETDIWGIVCRPTKFDPKRKYPVIENLYAGPHDSFVPKSFSPTLRMQRLAELGFIVVQIDGMGTRNRSKKFHDVAWKNLADAGFPDRKLWIRALAKKYPYVDASRVGVYGTSAGGQEATAALLFHGDFYKVAVSSCGCHDNRMDKVWWNEQWMGYPVGKHYEEQSNITNAKNLTGKLLLMVGELDSNVPPESTLRLVDALIKANKEFDFLILPGMDHTDGGPYGERKRRDFFVRHLHGVEPPDWNAFVPVG